MKPSKPYWYMELEGEPFSIQTFTPAVRGRVHNRLQANGRQRNRLRFSLKAGAVATLALLAFVIGATQLSTTASHTNNAGSSAISRNSEPLNKQRSQADTVKVGHEMRQVFTYDGIQYINGNIEEWRKLANGEWVVPYHQTLELPKNAYVEGKDSKWRAIIPEQDRINEAEKGLLELVKGKNPFQEEIKWLNVSLRVPPKVLPVNDGKQIAYTTRKETVLGKDLASTIARFTINVIDIDGTNDHVVFENAPAPVLLETVRDNIYVFEFLNEETHYITRINATTGEKKRLAANRIFLGISPDETHMLVQESNIGHFRLTFDDDINKKVNWYTINLLTGEEKFIGTDMMYNASMNTME